LVLLVNNSEHSQSARQQRIRPHSGIYLVYPVERRGRRSELLLSSTPLLLRKKEKKKKRKKKRKKRKKKLEREKKNKKTNKEKKGEFRAGLYPPGIESRDATPHAINGPVEVKKASFPPSSTTPFVLAHTGSSARNNGCARVAFVQS
jgi:hypothetical protein